MERHSVLGGSSLHHRLQPPGRRALVANAHSKTILRQASSLEPLLKGLLRSLGGSEANFLELCFGWFLYGNFHTKATSKKFRPPSGNFRPNTPPPPNFREVPPGPEAVPVRRLVGKLSYILCKGLFATRGGHIQMKCAWGEKTESLLFCGDENAIRMNGCFIQQFPLFSRFSQHFSAKSAFSCQKMHARAEKCGFREVLPGVGADGVGVKFPIFAVNCSRFSLSSKRIREKRRKNKKKTKKSEEQRKKNI